MRRRSRTIAHSWRSQARRESGRLIVKLKYLRICAAGLLLASCTDPLSSTPSGGGANGNYAHIYEDLVRRTGGIPGDVCGNVGPGLPPDYGTQLSIMGHMTGVGLQPYPIPCVPIEGSVRVTTSAGQVYDCPRGPLSDPQPACRFEGAKVLFAPPFMGGEQVNLQYQCPRL